jgi:PAS domain S-box-containing protein
MVDTAGIDGFVQNSPYPAWLATSTGECVYANPALGRLTGRNPDQINQADWRSFLFEGDREAASACWQESIAADTPYRMRVRMRGFDGQPKTVELIAFGHKVSEGTELWLFTGLPVHGQQHPRLEAQLQATLNEIPAHVWYAAPSGALTFVNQQCADYLGLPKDHPLRLGIEMGAEWDSYISFLHPDDHEETRRVWSTWLHTGCGGEVSFRVRNAERQYRWFLGRSEPIRASDGTLSYWIGVNLEIEERKQAEFYLAEGERLAHMGSWVLDPAGFFAYWSHELFHIYGLDPAKEGVSFEEYLAIVHLQDREFMRSLINRMFAEASGCDVTKRIVATRRRSPVRTLRCCCYCRERGLEKDCRHRNGCD